jgi:hypothetical protein
MPQPVPTGDNAKVYTGIRDITIYAGESSPGNRLPGGPYRRRELIAIAAIIIPTIWWVRSNVDSGYALPVLAAGAVTAVLVTVALRIFLPQRLPSLATRALFLWNTLRPPHCAATLHPRPAAARPRTPQHAHRRQL